MERVFDFDTKDIQEALDLSLDPEKKGEADDICQKYMDCADQIPEADMDGFQRAFFSLHIDKPTVYATNLFQALHWPITHAQFIAAYLISKSVHGVVDACPKDMGPDDTYADVEVIFDLHVFTLKHSSWSYDDYSNRPLSSGPKDCENMSYTKLREFLVSLA